MFSEDQILRLVRERVDHPATAKELLQLLKIPREERASFKRRLRALVASGALVEIRGHRFGLPDLMNLVVGRVSTNPRGFAFVEPEAPGDEGPSGIYIAGSNLNQAMHGDRVVVRVEHRRDGDVWRRARQGEGERPGTQDEDEDHRSNQDRPIHDRHAAADPRIGRDLILVSQSGAKLLVGSERASSGFPRSGVGQGGDQRERRIN